MITNKIEIHLKWMATFKNLIAEQQRQKYFGLGKQKLTPLLTESNFLSLKHIGTNSKLK